jgi:hypothetical protein
VYLSHTQSIPPPLASYSELASQDMIHFTTIERALAIHVPPQIDRFTAHSFRCITRPARTACMRRGTIQPTHTNGVWRACPQVNNTDYPGSDVGTSEPAATFDDCFASCCANPQCAGVLWEAKTEKASVTCTTGTGCCWQKSAMGKPKPTQPSVGAVAAAVDGRHPAPSPPGQCTPVNKVCACVCMCVHVCVCVCV